MDEQDKDKKNLGKWIGLVAVSPLIAVMAVIKAIGWLLRTSGFRYWWWYIGYRVRNWYYVNVTVAVRDLQIGGRIKRYWGQRELLAMSLVSGFGMGCILAAAFSRVAWWSIPIIAVLVVLVAVIAIACMPLKCGYIAYPWRGSRSDVASWKLLQSESVALWVVPGIWLGLLWGSLNARDSYYFADSGIWLTMGIGLVIAMVSPFLLYLREPHDRDTWAGTCGVCSTYLTFEDTAHGHCPNPNCLAPLTIGADTQTDRPSE